MTHIQEEAYDNGLYESFQENHSYIHDNDNLWNHFHKEQERSDLQQQEGNLHFQDKSKPSSDSSTMKMKGIDVSSTQHDEVTNETPWIPSYHKEQNDDVKYEREESDWQKRPTFHLDLYVE